MKLKPEEIKRLETILEPFRNDERTHKMKQFIQHGKITTYEHAESVTKLSYWINKRLHIHADEKVLTVGAFLHDYYLYDWHETDEGNGLHGFSHSRTARRNAVAHFGICKRTQSVIETHMWPLTFTKVPKSREAWIVCLADKWVSTRETLLCR
ncbi:MAG: HD family phosphohydrolase [Pseudobutyrivibrio sp.]|nr:HD family phosphohydrolase [Pseudobutyrivibrio sp.]